jgi:type IV secretory pathway VirB10-like protein
VNRRRATGRVSLFLLPLLGFAAIGCASSTSKPVDARAAGEWTFRLPETQSPYASLAVAHGTGTELAALSADEMEAAPAEARTYAVERKTKPQPAARTRQATPTPQKAVRPQPTAPPAAIEAPQPVAAPSPELLALNTPGLATAPANSDAERYAGREAKSERQREYRGGDAIVISVSALIIILLVVLLIILLT